MMLEAILLTAITFLVISLSAIEAITLGLLYVSDCISAEYVSSSTSSGADGNAIIHGGNRSEAGGAVMAGDESIAA